MNDSRENETLTPEAIASTRMRTTPAPAPVVIERAMVAEDGEPADERTALGRPMDMLRVRLPRWLRPILARVGRPLRFVAVTALAVWIEQKWFNLFDMPKSVVVLMTLVWFVDRLREHWGDEADQVLKRKVISPGRWLTPRQRLVTAVAGLVCFVVSLQVGESAEGAWWVAAAILAVAAVLLIGLAMFSQLDDEKRLSLLSRPRPVAAAASREPSLLSEPDGEP